MFLKTLLVFVLHIHSAVAAAELRRTQLDVDVSSAPSCPRQLPRHLFIFFLFFLFLLLLLLFLFLSSLLHFFLFFPFLSSSSSSFSFSSSSSSFSSSLHSLLLFLFIPPPPLFQISECKSAYFYLSLSLLLILLIIIHFLCKFIYLCSRREKVTRVIININNHFFCDNLFIYFLIKHKNTTSLFIK